MKLQHFKILFDEDKSTFVAGDHLTGSIVFSLKYPLEVKGVFVAFEGFASTEWTTSEVCQASERYLHEQICFFGTADDALIFHPAGIHKYHFDIILPATAPSSFEGSKGHVRYKCHASIDRGWKGIYEEEKIFTVIHHLDLNNIASVSMPVCGEEEDIVEGCCFDQGTVYAKVSLQKKGFVPEEPLNFNVEIQNMASSPVPGFSLQLQQNVAYKAYSGGGIMRLHTKCNSLPLFDYYEVIPKHSTKQIMQTATIPALPPSKLEGCHIIDINYELVLGIGNEWNNGMVGMEIILGTLPLREQNEIPLPGTSLALPTENPCIPLDAPPSYEECVMMSKQVVTEGDWQTEGRPICPQVYQYHSNWPSASASVEPSQATSSI